MAKRALLVILGLLMIAGASFAAPRAKTIMRGWKADTAVADAMASGVAPFDADAVTTLLRRYAEEAAQLNSALSDRDARAKDFKTRLTKFSSDAEAAARAGDRQTLTQRYRAVRQECRACHDLYGV